MAYGDPARIDLRTFPAHRSRPGPGARGPLAALVAVAAVVVVLPAVPATADDGRAAAPSVLARTATGLEVEALPVPAADAAARGAGLAAELRPTPVASFGLVGVTWETGSATAGTVTEVRVHEPAGWTGWLELHWEPTEGPAPGSSTRESAGPMWVGDADAVAVRVSSPTGASPSGLRVVTVDPGAEPAGMVSRGPATVRPPSGRPIKGPVDFPNMPRVITRKQWGADPDLTSSCDSPRYASTARMVFVHHTVNANNYSARESPAMVRSILAYHTQAQGWCDIGYNALVDRFGNVYEGRRGGIRKPVRGAHAGDYNTGSVGVSLLGNFENKRPRARMKNALVRFIGWRLGTSYKPVHGRVGVQGTRFRRISGHRDAMSTACPGRYAYSMLPRLRGRVSTYLSKYDSRLAAKADALGGRRTGYVKVGERAVSGGFRTVFRKGRMYGKDGFGAHLLKNLPLRRYRGSGGVGGVLGWPKSDVVDSPIGNARVLIAQRGRMYLRAIGPKVVHGPIYRRYLKQNLASGRLGFPVTNVRDTRRGERTNFQHGTIWWNENTGKTKVRFR